MAIDANERRDCDLEWNHFSGGWTDGQTDRERRREIEREREGRAEVEAADDSIKRRRASLAALSAVKSRKAPPHRDNDVKNEPRRR